MGNVQDKLRQSYRFLFDPLWVPAAIHQISWESDDLFRLFVSGDIQDENHLKNMDTIARNVPHVTLWLPSREREIILSVRKQLGELAPNLFIRASGTTVDGPPPTWNAFTSTVVTDQSPGPDVCPAKEQGGKCLTCRACTDPNARNVIYRKT